MFKRFTLLILLLGVLGFIIADVPQAITPQSVLNPVKMEKPTKPKPSEPQPEGINWVEVSGKPELPPPLPEQYWVEIGTGTSYEPWPMYRYYNYSTWQGIYLQTEINMAGNIVAIGFNNYSTGGVTIENVSIYMRETTATTLTSGSVTIPPPSPWVLVWQGSWPNQNTGWQYVTLQTPFYYSNTPGSNLIILIVKGYQGWTYPYPYWYYHSTPQYLVRRYYSDVSQPTYLYATYNRPNIRLGFPIANDVGVTTPYNVVNYPVVAGDEDQFWFRVANMGENNQTNIPVKMMVDGSVVQEITIPSLNSGSYLDTFFAWTPPSPGTYTLKFFTDLSNDMNRANDTLTKVEGATYVVNEINESFEGSFPPTGWVVQNLNGGYTWSQSDNYAKTGTYSCRNTADEATYYENNSNDVLLSPIVDLSALPTCFFDFFHRWNLESGWDSVVIYYTTEADFDNPNPTWTRLMKCTGNYLADWQAFSQILPTSNRMRLMWRFLSDPSITWEGYYLDDVRLWVPYNDVGVSEILSPPANFPPEPVIPKAKVKNYGVNNQPEVPVQCLIRDESGSEVYNETVTIYDLLSGEEREVEFPAWTPTEGVYYDTMRTLLSGDQNPDNDYKGMMHNASVWAEIEVGYDDGVPEAYYWVQYPSGANDRFAVKITPPAANYQIKAGKFNISASVVPLSFADCGVYPESAGIPQLSSPIVTVPNQPTATTIIPTTEWKTVDFGNVPVSSPNDVFLVVHWPTGSYYGPYVSADASAPEMRSYWSMTPPPGTWNLWTLHDWMMRLVFRIPGIDAGVSQIIAPTGTVDFGTPITPEVVVWNYGYYDRTFKVFFQASKDGNLVYADTVELTMSGNSSQNVTFEEWTPAEPGTYQLYAATILTNDLNPGNDAAQGEVFIRYYDCGITQIVRPNETENPGMVPVSIRFKNFGNVPANNIRIQVIITDQGGTEVYNDFRDYSVVGVGEEILANLTPWVATGGVYQLNATLTPGDMNPNNNQAQRQVTVGQLDAELVAIIGPKGYVDTLPVVPKVKVKNNSSVTLNIPVRFTITGPRSYTSDAVARDVAPNAVVDVEFDIFNITAADTGLVFHTEARTLLAGDNNPANDVKTDSFTVKAGGAPPLPPGWHKMADVSGATKPVKSGGALTSLGDKVYALVGNNTRDLMVYDVNSKTWTKKGDVPLSYLTTKRKNVKKGASICTDGQYIYVIKGNNTKEFWRYNPATDSWKEYEVDFSKGIKGSSMAFDGDSFIYVICGSNNNEWKRFNRYTETFEACNPATLPADKWKTGSWIVYVPGETPKIYALRVGGKINEFYMTTIGGTWTSKPEMPLIGSTGRKKKVKEGSAGAYNPSTGKIYALKGGNTLEFFSFNPTNDSWKILEDVGQPEGKPDKRVKGGGALTYSAAAGGLFAFVGSNTNEFWFYLPGTTFLASAPTFNNGIQSEIKSLRNFTLTITKEKGYVKVAYSLPVKLTAKLTLYNALGEVVYSARSDKNYFIIDTKQLPTGIYIMKFNANEYKATRKLLIH